MKHERHILRYIQGTRRGRKANALERESLDNAFLHEALEGLEHDPALAQSLHSLHARIQQASGGQQQRTWMYYAAAAVVALVMLGGIRYITHTSTTPHRTLAHEMELSAPTTGADTTQLAIATQAAKAIHTPSPVSKEMAERLVTVDNQSAILLEEGLILADEVAPTAKSETDSEAKHDVYRAQPTTDTQHAAKAEVRLAAAPHATQVVSGTVVDPQGERLVGVVVYNKHLKQHTTTDIDGQFSIAVANPNDSLSLQYIGFENVLVAAGQVTQVAMVPSSVELSDVVVIGYGIQRKAKVNAPATLAQFMVKGEDIAFDEWVSQQYEQQWGVPNTGIEARLVFTLKANGNISNIQVTGVNDTVHTRLIQIIKDSQPHWQPALDSNDKPMNSRQDFTIAW